VADTSCPTSNSSNVAGATMSPSTNLKVSVAQFSSYLSGLREWAMLGSNQRPPPCKGELLCSPLFLAVQKHLQIS
jgi:hypothetical protein